ncbi:MAG TPA: sigma-70 family RNA polymerase sigma factor [Hanamia sp.]|nr:sigma-70 family RNA polymerase sigma factor [Hanamia sp.]
MIIEEIAFDLKDLKQREEAFEQLYEEVFPVIADIVSRQGGSFQDAKDIFQDALIIFYEKNVSGALNVRLSEEAYIVGIAKHLWNKKLKSKYKLLSLDSFEKKILLPEDYFEVETSKTNRLLHLLEVAGKKCVELLRSIYYDKLSLNEVSQIHGFSNAHSASVQKYKCIEKIKVIVEQKSLSYEDLME